MSPAALRTAADRIEYRPEVLREVSATVADLLRCLAMLPDHSCQIDWCPRCKVRLAEDRLTRSLGAGS